MAGAIRTGRGTSQCHQPTVARHASGSAVAAFTHLHSLLLLLLGHVPVLRNKTETRVCGNGACPVDCELTDWSNWTACEPYCAGKGGEPGSKFCDSFPTRENARQHFAASHGEDLADERRCSLRRLGECKTVRLFSFKASMSHKGKQALWRIAGIPNTASKDKVAHCQKPRRLLC